MAATQRIAPGTVFDMAASFVHLAPDGSPHILTGLGGAHLNMAGIGAPTMTRDAPHGGELHPDGDELLYVTSGHLQVSLDGRSEVAEVAPGQAFVIQQGTWHRVHVVEPAKVLHFTPGPNSRTRPRTATPEGAP
jgi:quercetin dioxygenase-like cupin family protein